MATRFILLVSVLMYLAMSKATDVIVAQDGSGQFSSIQAAIDAAPTYTFSRYTIHIRKGKYSETVNVNKQNISLVGDGMDDTIISGRKSNASGVRTYDTCTVCVDGAYFMALNLTIENTAGPTENQAVALRVSADRTIIYNCRILGFQDTLYATKSKQFYRDCHIYGTVDFIFGDAASIFQNCVLYLRRPILGQEITVTAQGREKKDDDTGIVLQNCTILHTDELVPYIGNVKIYLGRPWKTYAVTVVMQSMLDRFIDPVGWEEWQGSTNHLTTYYGEFRNRGLGSNTTMRANWTHPHMTVYEAIYYTVDVFIGGNKWIPSMGVPFTPGL